MDAWTAKLTGLMVFYLICAVVGGAAVALRIVLQIFGVEHGADDLDAGDSGGDADTSFTLLSFHALSSFLLLFGLTGYALAARGASPYVSIVAAIVAGYLAVWLIAYLYRTFHKLQSSGTIGITSAVGCEGSVYLTIPENGAGMVMVKIGERVREYDARSLDGTMIPTDAQVVVTGVRGNVLLVKPI